MIKNFYRESDELRESTLRRINELSLDGRTRKQAYAAINNLWKGLRLHLTILAEEGYIFPETLKKIGGVNKTQSRYEYHLAGVRRHLHNLENLPEFILVGENILNIMGSEIVMDYEELEKCNLS